MAIVNEGTAVAGTTSGGTAPQITFTVPAATDFLAAWWTWEQGAGDETISTATHNGNTMTLGTKRESTSGANQQEDGQWVYMSAPDTGASLDLVANFSASVNDVAVIVFALSGVDQTTPIRTQVAGDFDAGNTQQTTYDNTLTSSNDNSLLLGGCVINTGNAGPWTQTSGGAALDEEIQLATGLGLSACGVSLSTTAAGSYTVGADCTPSSARQWIVDVLEVNEAVGGGSNIPAAAHYYRKKRAA